LIALGERTGKALAPQSGDATCATGAGGGGEPARGMAALQGRDTQGLDAQRNSPTLSGRAPNFMSNVDSSVVS